MEYSKKSKIFQKRQKKSKKCAYIDIERKQTAGHPAERKNKMSDGRRSVCENKSPLIDIIVAEVLRAHPRRVFNAQEIYQELVARQLYRFSDDAKTPCNSICTRLSTGIKNRFPRLRRAGRGQYYAI